MLNKRKKLFFLLVKEADKSYKLQPMIKLVIEDMMKIN